MPDPWLPVAVGMADGSLSIHWAGLGDIDFTEPFFDQTVRRRLATCPPLRRTGMAALFAPEIAAARPPGGIVFHLPRSGSTLVCRMLSAVPGLRALSEPDPVNGFLLRAPACLDHAASVRGLRALVMALGRPRRHYVLKTSSWNVRHVGLFRAAFPEVPMVWLRRDPGAVLASLLKTPAGWMDVQHVAPYPEALFGIPASRAARQTRSAFCADVLATLQAPAEAEMLDVAHDELPDAVWQRIAPLFGLDISAGTIADMRRIASVDAKTGGPRRHLSATGDAPQSDTASVAAGNGSGALPGPLDQRAQQQPANGDGDQHHGQ